MSKWYLGQSVVRKCKRGWAQLLMAALVPAKLKGAAWGTPRIYYPCPRASIRGTEDASQKGEVFLLFCWSSASAQVDYPTNCWPSVWCWATKRHEGFSSWVRDIPAGVLYQLVMVDQKGRSWENWWAYWPVDVADYYIQFLTCWWVWLIQVSILKREQELPGKRIYIARTLQLNLFMAKRRSLELLKHEIVPVN